MVTWFFPPQSNLFSRVHEEQTVAFLGAVFDFWSDDLEFVEVDGRAFQHSYSLEGDQVYETMYVVNLAPGSHLLGVRAVKGPAEYAGVPHLLGARHPSSLLPSQARSIRSDSVELKNLVAWNW